MKEPIKMFDFMVGGFAGVISRTLVAPFDKIKILMQIEKNKIGIFEMVSKDIKIGGVKHLWKGNAVNSIRIFPYSGCQFLIYNLCKTHLSNENEILSKKKRLLFGLIAGSVATSATHPIDVVRHRLMYYNLNNSLQTVKELYCENGARSFFKGYGSSVLSLTPFIGLNFFFFDLLKEEQFKFGNINENYINLLLGSASAFISQGICFPLDTIRRRMLMKENNGIYNVCKTLILHEGMSGFYKGMSLNILKMVPSTAIRFTIFEFIKNNFNK